MREYICDYCHKVMEERYPWPREEERKGDFCSEKCYESSMNEEPREP
jgi:hypothetical protein